ncbi:MAG: response regulator [Fibrobacter sp.]|nr:response regulator [Fibrobacter sp.]
MISKQILVVDDDISICIAFKKLLQRDNVNVDTCDNIDSAKKQITMFNYDAVISDLRLSGSTNLDGLEIVNYTKQLHPQTIVALISAYRSKELQISAEAMGADFFLEKPVSQKELCMILKCLDVY